jgi:small subunit ribosomal protein S6e
VFRIAGGNDKQGFPMRQGIMVDHRVKILMSKGHACYRPRVKGERKRKAVRGCIVQADMAVLHLVVVKKGDEEIPGLTDREIPRRKAPKRANKIRKLFNLTKDDDVTQYVIRREIPGKDGKKGTSKAPKIQRLVTPQVLQRKRARLALKKKWSAKSKAAAAEYEQMLAARAKAKRAEQASKRSKRSGSKA